MKTMEQKREVKAGNHKRKLAKKRNGRLRNYVLYYILYTVHLTAFYVYKTKYINETVSLFLTERGLLGSIITYFTL